MSIYFIWSKDRDDYVRVSRKQFHFFLSSIKDNLFSSNLFDNSMVCYFIDDNLIEFYDKPIGFYVRCSDV